MVKLSFWFRSQ